VKTPMEWAFPRHALENAHFMGFLGLPQPIGFARRKAGLEWLLPRYGVVPGGAASFGTIPPMLTVFTSFARASGHAFAVTSARASARDSHGAQSISGVFPGSPLKALPRAVALACLGVTSAASGWALAQTPADVPSAQVVVTASRNEQVMRDAISHTTVITQKEIRDSQAQDLASLLRKEAGFEMSQNGGVGSTTSLFTRGGRGNQTLVLVDGVRLTDAAFGSTALQHIGLAEIDRVEIVRGNVSSLYGSNAIGGVIQVFTKSGRGPVAPTAAITLGSRGTTLANAGVGGSFNAGATRFNVTLSGERTKGFSAIDNRVALSANPDRDGYRNVSGAASLSHRITAHHELGARWYSGGGKVDYDNSFGAATNRHDSKQRLSSGQAYWNANFLPMWKSRVTLGVGRDDRTDRLNGAFNSTSDTHNRQLNWDNEIALAPDHTLGVGAEWLKQSLDNRDAFTNINRERRDRALRLSYNGRFATRHALQGNLRFTRTSDYGSHTTGLLGYGFDLTPAWRLTVSASNAFRAPTFIDQFGFGGDPLLKPEKARSVEAGVQYAEGAHLWRAVAFFTKYQDAITFSAGKTRNLREADNQGLEMSYTGQLAGFDLRAALTLQDPREREPGGLWLQGVRRAHAFGSFSAHRSFGAWRLGGELTASGNRPDSDINTFARKTLGGYEVVNLMARYEFTKNLYAAAKLENALNRKYRLVDGYNVTPRGVFFTLGWKP
jgi:vitamin B12 transporter